VRVFAFGLVLLGLCVFAWGLRYKLSLYAPPHSIAHRMPAAKLLIGKDRLELPAIRPSRDADFTAPLALTVLVAAFAGVIPAKFKPGWGAWALRLPDRALILRCVRNGAAFVRPPPFIR